MTAIFFLKNRIANTRYPAIFKDKNLPPIRTPTLALHLAETNCELLQRETAEKGSNHISRRVVFQNKMDMGINLFMLKGKEFIKQ